MSRPIPTEAIHFTRIEHLRNIATRGLLSDNLAQAEDLLQIEVGELGIKEARRRKVVPLPPGGVVADYVPFYFAARSPMMCSIHHNNVSTYQDGCDRLIHLVTSIERVHDLGLTWLVTDRNARQDLAEFRGSGTELDHVDWPLMKQKYWFDTPEYTDRKECRMAELLVHQAVPFEAFDGIVVKTPEIHGEVVAVLDGLDLAVPVTVGASWYF